MLLFLPLPPRALVSRPPARLVRMSPLSLLPDFLLLPPSRLPASEIRVLPSSSSSSPPPKRLVSKPPSPSLWVLVFFFWLPRAASSSGAAMARILEVSTLLAPLFLATAFRTVSVSPPKILVRILAPSSVSTFCKRLASPLLLVWSSRALARLLAPSSVEAFCAMAPTKAGSALARTFWVSFSLVPVWPAMEEITLPESRSVKFICPRPFPYSCSNAQKSQGSVRLASKASSMVP